MELVICSPQEYYARKFLLFIQNECNARHNRWVYAIVNKKFDSSMERVFIDRSQWCLCLDKHHGQDARYLVIFKDTALQTLRDLRGSHTPLLQEIAETVNAWIRARHTSKYVLYFHYMPSIFQLHLHVNSNLQCVNYQRAHFLSTVLKNIEKDSQYYTHALILTKMCKTIRRAETHRKLQVHI